ncbi:ribosome maturation factor RimP [Dongia sp.]|uniref:ribosome maturation factor RimP n=1 Tax=Dongia sp. TaxID=1977262 RepID=UPI0035B356FF
MSLTEQIEQMIGPSIEALGYEVVRVSLAGSVRKVLQIMAEPKDGRVMSVEDCARVSRAISAILDVEDPISGAYSLEVSSPGIDRPLTRPKDYDRYAGHEAKIETHEPIDGRKRFKGTLKGVTDETVKLVAEGEEVALPLNKIAKAKLVLTDALIAAHQAQEAAAEMN